MSTVPVPAKSKKEKTRDLKVRLHDASAREQLMMIGSKLSNAHFPEFPEMVHLFPDVDVDLKSCRGALVKFLFSKPLHWFLIVLLCLDVLLVITGLQLKIEVASLEGTAIASCLGLAIPSGDAEYVEVQHTFLTIEEAKVCVEEKPEHKTAVTLEEIDHIFTIASISILVIFLVENIMFMFAFHLSYFKIIYFPFDLFVVLVSMASEILAIVHHSKDEPDVNTTTSLGTASSLYREGGSPVAALLIMGRFWRFARIGHAVYLLQAAEEKEEELEELHDELQAKQELAEKAQQEEPDPAV